LNYFVHELFDRYGICSSSFSSRSISEGDPFKQIDGIDVFIFLTHLKKTFVRDLLDYGAVIFSLGIPLLFERRSAAGGLNW
jgi:hypothetical protein